MFGIDFTWVTGNQVGSNGVNREVFEHVEGNIFKGYEWVKNDELDLSKNYKYGAPLI